MTNLCDAIYPNELHNIRALQPVDVPVANLTSASSSQQQATQQTNDVTATTSDANNVPTPTNDETSAAASTVTASSNPADSIGSEEQGAVTDKAEVQSSEPGSEQAPAQVPEQSSGQASSTDITLVGTDDKANQVETTNEQATQPVPDTEQNVQPPNANTQQTSAAVDSDDKPLKEYINEDMVAAAQQGENLNAVLSDEVVAIERAAEATKALESKLKTGKASATRKAPAKVNNKAGMGKLRNPPPNAQRVNYKVPAKERKPNAAVASYSKRPYNNNYNNNNNKNNNNNNNNNQTLQRLHRPPLNPKLTAQGRPVRVGNMKAKRPAYYHQANNQLPQTTQSNNPNAASPPMKVHVLTFTNKLADALADAGVIARKPPPHRGHVHKPAPHPAPTAHATPIAGPSVSKAPTSPSEPAAAVIPVTISVTPVAQLKQTLNRVTQAAHRVKPNTAARKPALHAVEAGQKVENTEFQSAIAPKPPSRPAPSLYKPNLRNKKPSLHVAPHANVTATMAAPWPVSQKPPPIHTISWNAKNKPAESVEKGEKILNVKKLPKNMGDLCIKRTECQKTPPSVSETNSELTKTQSSNDKNTQQMEQLKAVEKMLLANVHKSKAKQPVKTEPPSADFVPAKVFNSIVDLYHKRPPARKDSRRKIINIKKASTAKKLRKLTQTFVESLMRGLANGTLRDKLFKPPINARRWRRPSAVRRGDTRRWGRLPVMYKHTIPPTKGGMIGNVPLGQYYDADISPELTEDNRVIVNFKSRKQLNSSLFENTPDPTKRNDATKQVTNKYNPTEMAFTQKAPVLNYFASVKDAKKSLPTRLSHKRNPFPAPMMRAGFQKQKSNNRIAATSIKAFHPVNRIPMRINSNYLKTSPPRRPNIAFSLNQLKSNNLISPFHGKLSNGISPTVSKSNRPFSPYKLKSGFASPRMPKKTTAKDIGNKIHLKAVTNNPSFDKISKIKNLEYETKVSPLIPSPVQKEFQKKHEKVEKKEQDVFHQPSIDKKEKESDNENPSSSQLSDPSFSKLQSLHSYLHNVSQSVMGENTTQQNDTANNDLAEVTTFSDKARSASLLAVNSTTTKSPIRTLNSTGVENFHFGRGAFESLDDNTNDSVPHEESESPGDLQSLLTGKADGELSLSSEDMLDIFKVAGAAGESSTENSPTAGEVRSPKPKKSAAISKTEKQAENLIPLKNKDSVRAKPTEMENIFHVKIDPEEQDVGEKKSQTTPFVSEHGTVRPAARDTVHNKVPRHRPPSLSSGYFLNPGISNMVRVEKKRKTRKGSKKMRRPSHAPALKSSQSIGLDNFSLTEQGDTEGRFTKASTELHPNIRKFINQKSPTITPLKLSEKLARFYGPETSADGAGQASTAWENQLRSSEAEDLAEEVESALIDTNPTMLRTLLKGATKSGKQSVVHEDASRKAAVLRSDGDYENSDKRNTKPSSRPNPPENPKPTEPEDSASMKAVLHRKAVQAAQISKLFAQNNDTIKLLNDTRGNSKFVESAENDAGFKEGRNDIYYTSKALKSGSTLKSKETSSLENVRPEAGIVKQAMLKNTSKTQEQQKKKYSTPDEMTEKGKKINGRDDLKSIDFLQPNKGTPISTEQKSENKEATESAEEPEPPISLKHLPQVMVAQRVGKLQKSHEENNMLSSDSSVASSDITTQKIKPATFYKSNRQEESSGKSSIDELPTGKQNDHELAPENHGSTQTNGFSKFSKFSKTQSHSSERNKPQLKTPKLTESDPRVNIEISNGDKSNSTTVSQAKETSTQLAENEFAKPTGKISNVGKSSQSEELSPTIAHKVTNLHLAHRNESRKPVEIFPAKVSPVQSPLRTKPVLSPEPNVAVLGKNAQETNRTRVSLNEQKQAKPVGSIQEGKYLDADVSPELSSKPVLPALSKNMRESNKTQASLKEEKPEISLGKVQVGKYLDADISPELTDENRVVVNLAAHETPSPTVSSNNHHHGFVAMDRQSARADQLARFKANHSESTQHIVQNMVQKEEPPLNLEASEGAEKVGMVGMAGKANEMKLRASNHLKAPPTSKVNVATETTRLIVNLEKEKLKERMKQRQESKESESSFTPFTPFTKFTPFKSKENFKTPQPKEDSGNETTNVEVSVSARSKPTHRVDATALTKGKKVLVSSDDKHNANETDHKASLHKIKNLCLSDDSNANHKPTVGCKKNETQEVRQMDSAHSPSGQHLITFQKSNKHADRGSAKVSFSRPLVTNKVKMMGDESEEVSEDVTADQDLTQHLKMHLKESSPSKERHKNKLKMMGESSDISNDVAINHDLTQHLMTHLKEGQKNDATRVQGDKSLLKEKAPPKTEAKTEAKIDAEAFHQLPTKSILKEKALPKTEAKTEAKDDAEAFHQLPNRRISSNRLGVDNEPSKAKEMLKKLKAADVASTAPKDNKEGKLNEKVDHHSSTDKELRHTYINVEAKNKTAIHHAPMDKTTAVGAEHKQGTAQTTKIAPAKNHRDHSKKLNLASEMLLLEKEKDSESSDDFENTLVDKWQETIENEERDHKLEVQRLQHEIDELRMNQKKLLSNVTRTPEEQSELNAEQKRNKTALQPFATAFNLSLCDNTEGTEINLDAVKRSECPSVKRDETKINKTIESDKREPNNGSIVEKYGGKDSDEVSKSQAETKELNNTETVNARDVGNAAKNDKNNSTDSIERKTNDTVDASSYEGEGGNHKNKTITSKYDGIKDNSTNLKEKKLGGKPSRLQEGKFLDNDISPELVRATKLEEQGFLKAAGKAKHRKEATDNLLTQTDEATFSQLKVNESFDLSSVNETEGFDLKKLNDSESSEPVYPNSTANSGLVNNPSNDVQELLDVKSAKDTSVSDVSPLVKEEGPFGFIRNTSSDGESTESETMKGKDEDEASYKNDSNSKMGNQEDKKPTLTPNEGNSGNKSNNTAQSDKTRTQSNAESIAPHNPSPDTSEGKTGMASLMQAVEEDTDVNVAAKPEVQGLQKNMDNTNDTNSRPMTKTNDSDLIQNRENITVTQNNDSTATHDAAVENIKREISDILINLSHTSPQLSFFSTKLDGAFKKVFKLSDEPELLSSKFTNILTKLKNISFLLQQETPKRSREHDKDMRVLEDLYKQLKSFVA